VAAIPLDHNHQDRSCHRLEVFRFHPFSNSVQKAFKTLICRHKMYINVYQNWRSIT